MLQHHRILSAFLALTLILTSCAAAPGATGSAAESSAAPASAENGTASNAETSDASPAPQADETRIVLSDSGITVDGAAVSADEGDAVYAANDIVFYLEGQDFTYGEGGEDDAHSQAEADAHTVLHIARAGVYRVSGTLSAGQIAVDLGEEAKKDPEAVVTLILDNVDITCTVAPAIIFYRVYECGSDDADTAASDVDTSAAGANLILAEGSENRVSGSYVAKIYKSYTLSEDGKSVTDSKKLHKYDGAVYSKMSMNVDGAGSLFIDAENEGLDSELHLTINGGTIRIESGDDGINTNEDGISVTTINGGDLTIKLKDSAAEGDGIDSNGWVVVNGGTVRAYACASSMDSGLDSDRGILLNGGTVIATGNMLDAIGEAGAAPFGAPGGPQSGQPETDGGAQTYAVFSTRQSQSAGDYTLTDSSGKAVDFTAENGFTILLYSSPALADGTATLSRGGQEIAASGGMGGMAPPDFGNGQSPDFGGMAPPDFGNGQRPDFGGMAPPDFGNGQRPDFGGMAPPDFGNGQRPDFGGMPPQNPGEGGNPPA